MSQNSSAENKLNGNVEEKLVIVTGFGPFVGHEVVNASWEAVNLLPNVINDYAFSYKLDKKLVPVEYKAVDEVVKEIWARKPQLVVHCGVHGHAKCVRVEKMAHNHQFHRPDYSGKYLSTNTATLVNSTKPPDHDIIRTSFDVRKICERVAVACSYEDGKKSVEPSNDVGDYLCGYIYLKSLDMDRSRCIFVHVPPISDDFPPEQTAMILLRIILECISQIEAGIKISKCYTLAESMYVQ